MRSLFDAGVDVFRLNASHGSQEDHAQRIRMVRELAAERERHAGILLDLQGPKIRLGTFKDGPYLLQEGSLFTITSEQIEGNGERASTNYADFGRDVKAGDTVLLADGAIELRVLETDGVAAGCEVINGGTISDRKGINLPGVHVSTPSLSKKDISDAHFGVEQEVDFLRSPLYARRGIFSGCGICSKKWTPASRLSPKSRSRKAGRTWIRFSMSAMGVMVARGDLGVEMALEKVPAIQKTDHRKSAAARASS